MDEKDYLTPADQEFENALRHLSPATGRIDPISAAFAAGKRSAQKRERVWQSTSALLLLMGFTIWFLPGLHQSTSDLAVRRPPTPEWVNTTVVTGVRTGVHVQTQRESDQPISNQSMAALERTVLDQGVDALPVANVPSQHALNPDKL
jgi:hypothetical protein